MSSVFFPGGCNLKDSVTAILAALSGLRGLRKRAQEVGREARGVWGALEGVGGSFDQNILSICMKLREKKRERERL